MNQIQIYRAAEDDKDEEEREGVSCWSRDPLVPGWQWGWHGAVCLHWKQLVSSFSAGLPPHTSPLHSQGPSLILVLSPYIHSARLSSPCHGRHGWFELDLLAGKVDSEFVGGWFAGTASVLQFVISVVAVIPQFPLNLLDLCQQFSKNQLL